MPEIFALTVWLLNIEAITDSEIASLYQSLSSQEQVFASRLKNLDTQKRYIANHALARRMVSESSAIRPELFEYQTDTNGRPNFFDTKSGVFFPVSLSRTEGLVASAFCPVVDFGIDIERISPANADRQLVRSFFSEPEQAMLEHLCGEQFDDSFFQVWTLKEAYVKAEGLGFSLPLDDFAFLLTPPRICFLAEDGRNEGDWSFVTRMPTEHHRLSAAVRTKGTPLTLEVRNIPVSYLISEGSEGDGRQ